MKLTQTVLGSALSLMLATAVVAAEKPPTFKALDADGDGSVTTAEFAKATESGVKQDYAKLDKDGDGKLTSKEYSVILEEDCE